MEWEKKTIALQYPVEIDGAKIEAVTIAMPNGRVMRKIEEVIGDGSVEMNLSTTMDLIGVMSDLPDAAVDELHMHDIKNVAEEMAPFLEQMMGPQEGDGDTSVSGSDAET